MIVEVDEAAKGVKAVAVGAIGPGVGPLVEFDSRNPETGGRHARLREESGQSPPKSAVAR